MRSKYIGAVIFLAVIVLIVGTVAVSIHLAGRTPPTHAAASSTTTGSTGVKADFSETVFPFAACTDSAFIKAHPQFANPNCGSGGNQDWVNYSTPNIQVPAHALVTVTIYNYTTPNGLTDPFLEQVQGVEGAAITVNGKHESVVDQNVVSHTFVIRGLDSTGANSTPYLYVSVPVTEANLSAGFDAAHMPLSPSVTVFQFKTQGPGHYIWNCEAPCGFGFAGKGGPMSTAGYMSGTLVVS